VTSMAYEGCLHPCFHGKGDFNVKIAAFTAGEGPTVPPLDVVPCGLIAGLKMGVPLEEVGILPPLPPCRQDKGRQNTPGKCRPYRFIDLTDLA
jgi:hypothetical protein